VAQTFHYPDLSARVYAGDLPPGLADELPDLYSSLFSTVEAFRVWDEITPSGACVLDSPRQVLFFSHRADTLDILNKMTEIPPNDVYRAARALFRAFPDVHRIHVEVMFDPHRLRVPKARLYWTDHMVIDMRDPETDCFAWLGDSTRRNVRKYEHRMRRDYPDISTEMRLPGDESRALFDQFLAWKIDRFREQGRVTVWEDRPELVDRFVELLRLRGEVQVTSVAGRPAAIVFLFPVGTATYAFQAAFDTAYERYRLGLVSLHQASCNALDRGMNSFNLLWGTTYYKERLGARPVRATTLSLFRTPVGRLRYLGEEREHVQRRLAARARETYWRLRHAAGDTLGRFAPRLREALRSS
jgi:hypothetical protein